MLTHRNIYLHALSVIAAEQTSPVTLGGTCCNSVTLHTVPLFHANGWGSAHTVTVVGGTHVMIHQFTPLEVFGLIERERVSCCAMVPTMVTALINSPEREKYDLSSLRIIMIGGAASSPALVKEAEGETGMCLHLRVRPDRNFSGAGKVTHEGRHHGKRRAALCPPRDDWICHSRR